MFCVILLCYVAGLVLKLYGLADWVLGAIGIQSFIMEAIWFGTKVATHYCHDSFWRKWSRKWCGAKWIHFYRYYEMHVWNWIDRDRNELGINNFRRAIPCVCVCRVCQVFSAFLSSRSLTILLDWKLIDFLFQHFDILLKFDLYIYNI